MITYVRSQEDFESKEAYIQYLSSIIRKHYPQGNPQQHALNRFIEVSEKCYALFKRKNKQYGNSIATTGLLGAAVSIIGAAARLPIMVVSNSSHGRDISDKLKDVLMDIANYSIIAVMMILDDNWEGK